MGRKDKNIACTALRNVAGIALWISALTFTSGLPKGSLFVPLALHSCCHG